uniref:Uncharacterized protein n=1 Tax=Rhizophora mucronata TaxID=61149 RepID=A0A2P2P8Y0_RHIMU
MGICSTILYGYDSYCSSIMHIYTRICK